MNDVDLSDLIAAAFDGDITLSAMYVSERSAKSAIDDKRVALDELKRRNEERDTLQSELQAARAKIEAYKEHTAQLLGDFAELTILLDRAYDGLDEYWVTLPENKPTVDRIAELVARKPNSEERADLV